MEQRDSRDQRGHRRTGSSSSSSKDSKRSSNLFICCFNWGSSMKGRKLRRSNNNGGNSSNSTKGSPMFKKGGEIIDEPSSPKVTCIGLVRVKTKRNKNLVMKKMRSKSKRRGGEASFRRIQDGHHQDNKVVVLHHQDSSLPHRDHRWIHLPFAICEALKGLMNQMFNCSFSGCSNCNCGIKNNRKSWCSHSGGNGCQVFMRWLFSLEERNSVVNNAAEGNHGDQNKKRETGIESPLFSSTSSTVSDVQFYRRSSVDESKEGWLLLMMKKMMLRSEPGRRSTLATRFLDDCVLMNSKLGIEGQSEELVVKSEAVLVEENRGKVETEQLDGEEVEINVNGSSPEPVLDRDDDSTDIEVVEEDETEKCDNKEQKRRLSFNGEDPLMVETLEEEKTDRETSMEEKSEAQEEEQQEEQEQSEIGEEGEEAEEEHCEDVMVNDIQAAVNGEEEDGQDQDGGESRRASNEIERTTEMLSDCLMMMMREPKVSMELSKETWVCSTDFIRHHQNHHHNKQVKLINGGDESKALFKTKPSIMIRKQKPITQPPQPPPRPPPCKPTPREKKQKPEPLELTRCKSEPLRSSAKLASEACFWKDMKLIVEPHRRSTVGAAGVGF
ncbi:hypothetical protein Scep_011452 [Stephania cephalantha]|uniref:Uncharacterized protein n=1 Tax=Stephania cephalantha TaxID=152367 RepID=A0AAP0JDA2_9MAGN